MLVTGGISSQLEQHLDKEKYYGLNDNSCTVLSRSSRCKLGLLSLNQTILSDIQVSVLSSSDGFPRPYLSRFLKMSQAVWVPRYPITHK